MSKFLIEEGSNTVLQKKLNQWASTGFSLKVHYFIPIKKEPAGVTYCALIERGEKEEVPVFMNPSPKITVDPDIEETKIEESKVDSDWDETKPPWKD